VYAEARRSALAARNFTCDEPLATTRKDDRAKTDRAPARRRRSADEMGTTHKSKTRADHPLSRAEIAIRLLGQRRFTHSSPCIREAKNNFGQLSADVLVATEIDLSRPESRESIRSRDLRRLSSDDAMKHRCELGDAIENGSSTSSDAPRKDPDALPHRFFCDRERFARTVKPGARRSARAFARAGVDIRSVRASPLIDQQEIRALRGRASPSTAR
jgi:hypothetical protein